MPARLHPDIGMNIEDEQERREWIALVRSIADLVDELGLSEEILFHGTSRAKAVSIMEDGMRPTDAFEVMADGSEEMAEGSFWGTIGTAAWYAEDTSHNRSGGAPVLIACPVAFLQTYSTLGADIPTRDFPIPGLTVLDDPQAAERWATGKHRTWQDSLADLGAVTALHEYDLPLDAAAIVEDIESLERILLSTSFSA